MFSNNLRSRMQYALGQRAAADEFAASLQVAGGLGTGNVFWVSSVVGGAQNGGLGSDSPLLTLEAALALCTANKGDTVILMPGHNEGMGNDTWDFATAGVTALGLGSGGLVPRFDFDHANASINIAASNCRVSNIRLLPSVTAVLIGIDVVTLMTGTVLEDIEVMNGEDAAGVDEFVLSVDLKVGVDGTRISRMKQRMHASTTHANAGISLSGASQDITIEYCDIVLLGTAGVSPIKGITTLSTNVRIRKNVLVSDDEPCIELLTGSTGVISENYCFSNLATIAAAIVADGCALFDNKYVEVAPEAGALIGTASVDD